jgi:PEGA domain
MYVGQPQPLLVWLSVALGASAIPCLPSVARADEPAAPSSVEPSAGDRATARTLAQQGFEALRDKDYATAIDRYTRALAIVHAPTLLRDLARAQVGLGKLVDAHENYSTIIREGVAADAPAPWAKAVADAKAEIGPLTSRLATLNITVTGPAHPRVTIDGAPIAEASLGVKRPADPGSHEIRAIAAGYYTAKKSVALKEGEAVNIAFELEDAPPDAAPKDEEQAGKVSVATVVDPPWRTPVTIGAFALGGAGLVVGGVTGVLAMSKHNKLASDCTGGVCGPNQKADYDGYHTLGMVSTIGFVAGGVGAGVGVVLLLVRPQILVQQQPGDQAKTKHKSFAWSPVIGVGSAGVEGTF